MHLEKQTNKHRTWWSKFAGEENMSMYTKEWVNLIEEFVVVKKMFKESKNQWGMKARKKRKQKAEDYNLMSKKWDAHRGKQEIKGKA